MSKKLFALIIICVFVGFQIVNNGGSYLWNIFSADKVIMELTDKLLSR